MVDSAATALEERVASEIKLAEIFCFNSRESVANIRFDTQGTNVLSMDAEGQARLDTNSTVWLAAKGRN